MYQHEAILDIVSRQYVIFTSIQNVFIATRIDYTKYWIKYNLEFLCPLKLS